MISLSVKVESIESPRTGKPVANQFLIHTSEGIFFQSYESIIGFYTPGKKTVLLDEKYWNYSRTTAKYRNQWLGETTKETQAKIDSGEYILTNLN